MAIFGKSPCQKVFKLPLYCHNVWNTCPKWINIVFLDGPSKYINFIWFLGGPKSDLMTSLWRHLDNLHKFLYSFEKTIKSYWSMPNFKSISFKMAVLQGGGQNLPSPCVCYPKDPMWNRVNHQVIVKLLRGVLFIVRAGNGIIKTDFMYTNTINFLTKMKIGIHLEELK